MLHLLTFFMQFNQSELNLLITTMQTYISTAQRQHSNITCQETLGIPPTVIQLFTISMLTH